jgi:hypothetical protein
LKNLLFDDGREEQIAQQQQKKDSVAERQQLHY